MLQWLKSTFKGIADTLLFWRRFDSKEELKKFFMLALIFGLIIGTYWTLRPLKDGLFGAFMDFKKYQPMAKWLSIAVIIPIILLYSKLISVFPKKKVFYGITLLYGILAICFMFAFMNPTIGLANTTKDAGRILGWLWYVYVESFGSLIVMLFWALVTDMTLPAAAVKGFPVIYLFAQFGQISGPFFLTAKKLGFESNAPVVGICGGLILLVGVLFWYFLKVTPAEQLQSYHGAQEEEEEPGFLEGLKLLLSQGYLLGIFFIVSAYEIIVTIADYQMKSTAYVLPEYQRQVVDPITGASSMVFNDVAYTAFLSKVAVIMGIVSTICVWIGVDKIQRKLGILTSLLILPLLLAAGVLAIRFNPSSLFVVMVVVVGFKAINYALNNPTIKQLYIPTTKDTKYKATAWIEAFGGRSAKAIGSGVTATSRKFATTTAFLTMAAGVSGVIIMVWVVVAIYIAKKYQKAVDNNEVVC